MKISALFLAFGLLAGCFIAYFLFSPGVLLVVVFGYAVLVTLERLKRPGLAHYLVSLLLLIGILLLHEVLQLKEYELQAFGGLFFIPLGTALLRMYFGCRRISSKEGGTPAASCIFGVIFLILGLVLFALALKGMTGAMNVAPTIGKGGAHDEDSVVGRGRSCVCISGTRAGHRRG